MHVKPGWSRQAAKTRAPTKWTSDHVDPCGKSSMGVLLDWLVSPGNYNRWRSCSSSGKSSRPLAGEIVQLLHAEGLVHRTPSQVQAKMTELELSYREAAERLASTKRELQAAEGSPAERNLHRVLDRHCRYFALLQPIMKDVEEDARPKKRPRLSTKRKTVQPVATANAPPVAPARAASPPPMKKTSQPQIRERRGLQTTFEDVAWDFGSESAGVKGPITPPTTRSVKKINSRPVESSPVMSEEGQARRSRGWFDEPIKKRPALRTMEEIDLEKARVELTLRQLELQMARDKALVTRAKARSQLLEEGVSRREVDRLMPFNI